MKGPMNFVYLMGAGRSGTTLLATLLGGHADIASRGELIHLPTMLGENGQCSCGAVMSKCPVWHAVYEQWHGMSCVACRV
jgi:hypothetical protein